MSQDVQWQVVEVPILGTDESVDPVLVPAGTITDSMNVEYTTKGGTLRKRPGLDLQCSPDEIGYGSRLIKFKDQLLVVDTNGVVHVPSPADEGYAAHTHLLSTKTVRRNAIASDINGLTVADVACTTRYVVHAFLNVNRDGIAVRVTDILSGEVVLAESIATPGVDKPRWIRAAASGEYVMIVYSDWSGAIYGLTFDCTTVPSGALSASLLGVATERLRSRELTITGGKTTTPRWFIAYPDVNDKGQIYEFRGMSMTMGWAQTFGDTVFAVSCIEHGDYVWYNWYDTTVSATSPVWMCGFNHKDTGVLQTASIAWCTSVDIGVPNASAGNVRSVGMSAISATEDPDVVLMLSSQDTQSFTTNPSNVADHIIDGIPVLRWRTVNTAFAKGDLNQLRGPQINSYPWHEAGTGDHYLWIAVQSRYNPYRHYNPSTVEWDGDVRTMTLCLLKLSETTSTAWLEATACGETVSYPFLNDLLGNVEGNRFASPQSASVDGNEHCHTVANIEPMPRTGEFGFSAPLTNPVEIVTRGDHLGRFSSVEFGNSVYVTGGVLTQYDGVSFYENNMVSPPALYTWRRQAVAGSWGTDWTTPPAPAPQYIGVYEAVSAYGERTLSPVTYACHGEFGTYSVANETEIMFDSLSVTRRNPEDAIDNFAGRVYMSIYRTPYPEDTSFQKLTSFTNNGLGLFECTPTRRTVHYVFDRGSSNSNAANPGRGSFAETVNAPGASSERYRIDANEPLYTTSGELENVLPYGGCTGIAVHQDRLWICGGEEADLIWYSKPRASNRSAEFALAQQIRIPGRSVVALASMDQLLYAFCEDAIFAIEGSGPNALGQEGFFSEPFPISLAIGTLQPRSVVSTPIGIFFRAGAGMYVIDRGTRQPVWVGAALADTFDEYPTVLAAKVVNDKTQVRFALGNDDGGILVVYDWEEQRWTKWQYANMGFVADLSDWTGHTTAVLSSDGGLYTENYSKFLDDTTPYYAWAETGWMSYGSLQGFKRIRKSGLLLEKLGSHGLDVQMWFNYTKTGLTATKSFSAAEINSISGPEWVRITMPYQKQPSIKMRLTEMPDPVNVEAGAGTAGFAWKSMAFEVGLMPGIKRLPQNQSK